ncbi:hypothetical protein RPHASCH2410_CH15255 [Rhizobium phaseoli Ch24-10]|nr:hypothetical protein RPHASCH2410_CH15255 [Rhizobium phaseoli Ch24-10]
MLHHSFVQTASNFLIKRTREEIDTIDRMLCALSDNSKSKALNLLSRRCAGSHPAVAACSCSEPWRRRHHAVAFHPFSGRYRGSSHARE